MIDNYDSFTYNLVQYLGELGGKITVFRNDKITIREIEKLNPAKIVISPGPGTPDQAGISLELVNKFKNKYPILGVCLGHQVIGQAFGGKITRAPYLMHGKVSKIFHDKKTIFKQVVSPFIATRYHSLIVNKKNLPDVFEISARTEDELIMGIRHKEYPLEGVQFHPESIMTDVGKKILKNFLNS